MPKFMKLFTRSAAELRNVRSLTLCALLIAIYAVSYSPFAGNFVIVPGMIEIRFGFVAIAVAAMLFGPVAAPVVAVIGDILGTLLFYGGAFFWGYTLSWLVQGFVFGLFFYRLKATPMRTGLCMVFNTCVINLLLTTRWEEMMGFGTFTGLFFKRLPLNMVMLPINAIVLYFVLRAIAALYQKMGYGALR